jgi:hypothetical protein
MSLSDFEIRYEEVMYQGRVATSVRGIALSDITSLIRGHLLEMNKVFELYEQEGSNDVAAMRAAEFALKLVDEVPDLVESIIIAATDETDTPELRATLRKLPIGLTIEVMRKIIEITVEDAGGAKKLLDNIVMTVRTMRPNLQVTA